METAANTACTCHVGPGKYEGESAFIFMAHCQANLGNSDYSTIRYDFLKAPWGFDADQSVVREALDYGYCAACVETYADDYRDDYGVVLWTSDQGFAGGRVLRTEAEWNQAIRDAEAEEGDDDE